MRRRALHHRRRRGRSRRGHATNQPGIRYRLAGGHHVLKIVIKILLLVRFKPANVKSGMQTHTRRDAQRVRIPSTCDDREWADGPWKKLGHA